MFNLLARLWAAFVAGFRPKPEPKAQRTMYYTGTQSRWGESNWED